MNKIDLLYGFIIGIVASVIGSYIFIEVFTEYTFWDGIQVMKAKGNLGKIITLGAILNLIIFFGLLKINKELMARGVILAMIILTIITLFV
ncbi:hypothetical protein [Flavobacterium sp.]|uniref:hypothetical protein n=1 Tax=Flavobacterium sp. TaxID=239 RepID=UPI002B4AB1CD|nr:hypothetical protein [Flavobacterium sp.]HLF51610.1 hypothetical protein [Flavobacterium sp.]